MVLGSLEGALRTTPVEAKGRLPSDLTRAASQRLGFAALVWAALCTFAVVMNNVVAPIISPGVTLDDAWPLPGNPVMAAVVVVSLALFAYTRRHDCDCNVSLDLGLLYQVTLAFAIGLVNQWTPNTGVGLSWICVVILIHPMIVPHTLGKTALAAVVAASMDPLGILIASARGAVVPSLPEIVWSYLPNYLCAALAVISSQVFMRLGNEVRDARELGSYRLGDLLGQGGMGEVYAARHRMLRRPAAIKVIRPSALGAREGEPAGTLVRRFRREAEAAASLHSSHSIALYDFGVTRDGNFYYVMELLRGLDLETLVQRFGPLPQARALYLLQQACHSLAEAHAIGLVHRDVKPANLYTCWVGLEPDFLKVLDFGLVKEVHEEGRDPTKLTAPDITTGTPAYMSPEQARGENVDGRGDIYALGCVAYWLLTGRLVFESGTPMKMMLAHIRDTPIAPSHRAELPVSPSVDALVLACLEKDPANRPMDAEHLARELAACDVPEPWTRDLAAAWWRSNLAELVPGLRTVPERDGTDSAAAT